MPYWLRHTAVLLVAVLGSTGAWTNPGAAEREQVERERRQFIETHIGPVPAQRRELDHMGRLWPGGGFYEVPARHLGEDIWAYLSFGLTNPDLPSALTVSLQAEPAGETGGGIVHDLRERLRGLTQSDTPPEKKAGYGYEVVVLTQGTAEWPYALLEWIVDREILANRNLLNQVEAEGGVALEDIRVSDKQYATVLIARAQHQFPARLSLPHGDMQWLVATVITDDELVWAGENGMDALLEKLTGQGVAQQSELERPSVIHPESIDYQKISSRKEALKLYEKGLLRKVYLFPPEFGGDEEDLNAVYLPRKAAIEKKIIDERVLRLARQGKITNYGAAPQYIGASFIPSAIEIRAIGEAGFEALVKSWEEKPFKVPSTTDIYRQLREQETGNR